MWIFSHLSHDSFVTFFASSLCLTNEYTSQESDSRLLLSSPHPLSSGTLGFLHRCPHSHFANTFSITPAVSYYSTYLLEMITQIFQHNFEHVKNKQKTHSFSIQTGSPCDFHNVTSFGVFPKEIILER